MKARGKLSQLLNMYASICFLWRRWKGGAQLKTPFAAEERPFHISKSENFWIKIESLLAMTVFADQS